MIKIFAYNTSEEGTTAIEFALLAVAFLSIIFAIFESGRIVLTWNSLQYSLENATRYALVNDNLTDQEISDYIDEQMGPLSVDNGDNVTVNVTYLTRSGVNFVELEGTYQFETVLPFLPQSWSTLDLRANSSLPIP